MAVQLLLNRGKLCVPEFFSTKFVTVLQFMCFRGSPIIYFHDDDDDDDDDDVSVVVVVVSVMKHTFFLSYILLRSL